MKKAWVIGGGVLVGLLLAVVLTAYLSLGNIAGSLIEQHGSAILGTRVTVNEVEVAPLDGYLAIRGLEVKNPKGFKADSIFRLAEVVVRIDTGTLGDSIVIVDELNIIEPQIYYELEFPEGSNIATVVRNIGAYQAEQEKPTGAEAAMGEPGVDTGDAGQSEELRLIIKDFRMLRAGLFSGTNVKNPVLQKFPDFHIQNVGADKGGATPAEVAQYIVGIISKRMLGM
ncbi:MAG: hypothetical protein HQ511_07235 [Rhodospirillales bacterium]|nr:hypothetical protein [Rhodospirillales bacterium]